MAELEDLITSISDAALRSDITREFAARDQQLAALKKKTTFGLVWEEQSPEVVLVPFKNGIRPHVGDRVAYRCSVERRLGRIADVPRPKDAIPELADRWRVEVEVAAGTEDVPVDDLLLVKSVEDALYPTLRPLGSVHRTDDRPPHVVINGENYHALKLLGFTHNRQFDLIYIDPPYNTGKGFTYADRRVTEGDSYRHSQWLAFMKTRLDLAKDLLTEDGVILVSIDDNEQARLKLLMDRVFGPKNFAATLVWNGGRKDAQFVSEGHDYVVAYTRSRQWWKEQKKNWRARKQGLEAIYAQVATLKKRHKTDYAAMRVELTAWYDSLPEDDPAKAHKHYNWIDARGLYFGADISAAGGAKERYEIIHPITERPVKKPSRNWHTVKEKMDRLLKEERIHFGADETTVPLLKLYLAETEGETPVSVFYQDRRAASLQLENLLGTKAFDFPKDASRLAWLFGAIVGDKPEARILDFFAGSGSTAQAVMELNEADGGRRQCVLVTNNEVEVEVESQLNDPEGAKAKVRAALAKAEAKGDTAKQETLRLQLAELEATLPQAPVFPGDPKFEAHGVFEAVTRPRVETIITGHRPDGSPVPGKRTVIEHGRPARKQPWVEGFEENCEFFELGFLDGDFIETAETPDELEVLQPLFWLQAGARADLSTSRPSFDVLRVEHKSGYAVLFDDVALSDMVAALNEQADVEHVFVVTDFDNAFERVSAALPVGIDTHMVPAEYLHYFQGGDPS